MAYVAFEVHFAGEHNLVSRDVEIAQRLTNVFFGSAEGVAVRGVDEVDASVDAYNITDIGEITLFYIIGHRDM